MGCGCKDDNKSPDLLNQETGELNIKGKLLKLPTALAVTLGIIIISPFLLIMIWFIAIKSVFGKDSNIIDMMLMKFQNKKDIDEPEEELGEFNEDDYEIVNVDIIK
tara:strand:- start:83 stop:400 length:318 start_codon:yes stop_codon:yes gene_type:complete